MRLISILSVFMVVTQWLLATFSLLFSKYNAFVNRDNSVIPLLLSITLSWYPWSVEKNIFPTVTSPSFFLLSPYPLDSEAGLTV